MSVSPGLSRLARSITTCSVAAPAGRSEEHTSELQSHHDLVCRLLLEKKNNIRRRKLPMFCTLRLSASSLIFRVTLSRTNRFHENYSPLRVLIMYCSLCSDALCLVLTG